MIRALITFLIGCLVLAVVIWVVNLVLALLPLPPAVAQIALIIFGLVGLLCLVGLALRVYRGGPPDLW